MTENWIQTDEAEDVAGSIRHVIRTAHFVGQDPLAWKWVILALHSALQGACVCHLTTTAAPLGAVTKENAKEWQSYFEVSRQNPDAKPPTTQLLALPDLLKAVRRASSAGNRSNSLGVTISDSELRWLCGFHKEFRNQFVHFKPVGWSIEISGIHEISKLVARIIGDIVGTGWAFRHMDADLRNKMQLDVETLAQMNWPI